MVLGDILSKLLVDEVPIVIDFVELVWEGKLHCLIEERACNTPILGALHRFGRLRFSSDFYFEFSKFLFMIMFRFIRVPS
jgi:hypothetical protein